MTSSAHLTHDEAQCHRADAAVDAAHDDGEEGGDGAGEDHVVEVRARHLDVLARPVADVEDEEEAREDDAERREDRHDEEEGARDDLRDDLLRDGVRRRAASCRRGSRQYRHAYTSVYSTRSVMVNRVNTDIQQSEIVDMQ